MSYSRTTIVNQAKSWIGFKESDGSHKKIIDVYNEHTPLAGGYKVKYTDPWCATFVSACAIKCGYTKIIPTECGCERMITLFKKINAWVEKDSHVPSPGDIIFYDWQDNGVGDNTSHSDHVGIVEAVNGNTITVIEGNYSDSVKRRTLKVNGQYIRGYGVPKYDVDEVENSAPTKTETSTQNKPVNTASTVKMVTANDPARSKLSSLAGTYTTTANLNMRHGAGVTKKIMVVVPKNTKVRNYGFYTTASGTKWLYVQVTIDNVVYTGFCSSKYLKKI